MADEDRHVLHIVFDGLYSIVRALIAIPWVRYASLAGRAIALPLRLAWVPLSWLGRLLAVLLSPFVSVLSYTWSWVVSVYGVFASLEPLFTFFAAAAAVGVVAGVAIAVSSSAITTNLGMLDDQAPTRRTHSDDGDISEDDDPKRPSGKTLLAYRAAWDSASSSADPDPSWHWESSPARHRLASGLMAQTIHEEDDDYDL